MALFSRKTEAEKAAERAAEGRARVERLKAARDVGGLRSLFMPGRECEETVEAAALALAELDDPTAMKILAIHAAGYSSPSSGAAQRALRTARGPVAVEWLLKELDDPEDPDVRVSHKRWLWDACVEVALDRVLDLVEASLDEGPRHVGIYVYDDRASYLWGFDKLDDERSLEILRKAARNEAQHVRQAAVDALAKRGDAESMVIVHGSPEIQALIAELEPDLERPLDPISRLRWQNDGVPPDPVLLSPAHPLAFPACDGAVERLVGFGEDAVEPLRHQLHRTTHAFRALGAIGGDNALSAVLAHLSSEDPRIVLATVQALGRLRDRRALDYLLRLDQKPVSRAAPMTAIPAIKRAVYAAEAAIWAGVEVLSGAIVDMAVREQGWTRGVGVLIKPMSGQKIEHPLKVAGTMVCHGCGADLPFEAHMDLLGMGGAGEARCDECGSVVAFTQVPYELIDVQSWLLVADPFVAPATVSRAHLSFDAVRACRGLGA